MRVLQLNVTANMSTGGIATDITRTLIRLGHKGCVAFSRGPAPAGVPYIRVGGEADYKLHGAMARLTDRSGFFSRRATEKLISDIKAYDPDIVHLHNLHGYYLELPRLFSYLKASGVPVVWTLHDCWAFTGHCAYFETAGCNRWETGCRDCPQRAQYPKSLFLDMSRRNYADKKRAFTGMSKAELVAPSEWLAGLARRSFLGVYPVRVIRNGIDLSVFRPTEGDAKRRLGIQGRRMLLSVANTWWEPRKGLSDLIELAGRLGGDYSVVVVGLNGKLMNGLPENITGLGRASSASELAELYTSADLYVCPSREETMGLTLAEAMACGTQVLCYDSSALPESITPETGLAIKPGDMDAFAKAAAYMCDNPAPAGACVERAAMFDKNERYLEYAALYISLLGGAGEGERCED